MKFTILRAGDGATLTVDAATVESYTPSITTTDHPIEDGSAVTDHAVALPLTFTVQAIVTETPMLPEGSTESTGVARLQDAIEFFNACTGQLLTISTSKLGDIESVLLTRYAHVVDKSGKLDLDLGFKVVTIAETGMVRFADTAVAGAPDSAALGRQIAQARALVASAQAKAQADLQTVSIARSGLDVLGVP